MRFPSNAVLVGFGAMMLLTPGPAFAHCDGLDGPVVTAARAALESGDPNPVLIWVQPTDEPETRAAFTEATAVRKLGPQAREMADRYFFETLVRLHRAGEGATYTGLKPAGADLGPAIVLADKAVASGSGRGLTSFIAEEAVRGIHDKFSSLQRKRGFRSNDLAAGREYVAAYVAFVHYVERLYQAAKAGAAGHFEEAPSVSAEHQD
jgi:hypothetical protein